MTSTDTSLSVSPPVKRILVMHRRKLALVERVSIIVSDPVSVGTRGRNAWQEAKKAQISGVCRPKFLRKVILWLSIQVELATSTIM